MSNQINVKSFLTSYGTHTLKMKCSATGYTDSAFTEKTINFQPYLSTDFDNEGFVFSHVLVSVTEYKIYGDTTLLGTFTTSQASTDDIFISCTDLGIDLTDYNSYHLTTTIDGVTYTSNLAYPAQPIGVTGFLNSTTALTRTGYAAGLSYEKTEITNGYKFTSGLDDMFPFNSITEVNVNGDIMIQIPTIYWKVEVDSNNHLVALSCARGPVDSDWFATPATQIAKYLASMENNQIFSKSGKSIINGTYINSYGFGKGNNFYPFTYYHLNLIKALFWIYFAERNDDLIFKQTGNTGTGLTGDTDACPFMNCIYNNRFKFMGIEDLNGYVFQTTWGVYNGYVFDFNNMQSQVLNYNDASADGKTQWTWPHTGWPTSFTGESGYEAMYVEPNLKFIWFPDVRSSYDTSNRYYAGHTKTWGFFNDSMIPNYGSDYRYSGYTPQHGFTWIDYTGRTSNSWGGRLVRFLS